MRRLNKPQSFAQTNPVVTALRSRIPCQIQLTFDTCTISKLWERTCLLLSTVCTRCLCFAWRNGSFVQTGIRG